jgi:hypothetical protein
LAFQSVGGSKGFLVKDGGNQDRALLLGKIDPAADIELGVGLGRFFGGRCAVRQQYYLRILREGCGQISEKWAKQIHGAYDLPGYVYGWRRRQRRLATSGQTIEEEQQHSDRDG